MQSSALRITIRTLGRHRGFAAVSIACMALAIAMATTLYGALDGLLAPRIDAVLPEHVLRVRYFGDRKRQLPAGAIEEALRTGVPGIVGVARMQGLPGLGEQTLAEHGSQWARVSPLAVSPNFFDFLGTRALAGRTLLERDAGSANAVISDRLAERLFGGVDRATGRSMTIEGTGYEVIGVVRRSPAFAPLSADIWVAHTRAPAGNTHTLLVRTRERVAPHALGGRLQTLATRLALAAGEAPGETAFRGTEYVTRNFSFNSVHYALIAAVIAVLLVACANLANLQLARGLSRARELALRSTLGASRWRLIAPTLAETSLLAMAGLALGVVLSLWGGRLLESLMPPLVAGFLLEPQMSWRTLAAASGAAVLCMLLVGLLPAVRIARVDPNDLLKSGAGTGATARNRRRYAMLVAVQIGLAVPLLIGSFLMLQSAWKHHSREFLIRQYYGYDPFPVVTARVPFVNARRTSIPAADIAADMSSRARSVPGVLDAAARIGTAPDKSRVTVYGDDGAPREVLAIQWNVQVVTPSYLRVLGVPLARGREFMDGESGEAVIVDAGTARYLWGGADPIGKAIKFGDVASRAPWHVVVGVTGDLRDTASIRRRDPTWGMRLGTVYRAMTPRDTIAPGRRSPNGVRGSITLVARVEGSTELAAVRLQRALREAAADEPPTVEPLEYAQSGWIRDITRFFSGVFGAFAIAGLGLAAIGVYGIVAHSVAERRRELAVRLALGATRRNLVRFVLREGNVVVLLGVAAGLVVTVLTMPLLGGLAMVETGIAPAVLIGAWCALLALAFVLAAVPPAWRASAVNPSEALRDQG